MKTYWGGATIFLLADIELRARSGNQASLDTVLDDLRRCCVPSARTWNGRQFFTEIDRLSPFPLFVALYDRHDASTVFAVVSPQLARLGRGWQDGVFTLDDHA